MRQRRHFSMRSIPRLVLAERSTVLGPEQTVTIGRGSRGLAEDFDLDESIGGPRGDGVDHSGISARTSLMGRSRFVRVTGFRKER